MGKTGEAVGDGNTSALDGILSNLLSKSTASLTNMICSSPHDSTRGISSDSSLGWPSIPYTSLGSFGNFEFSDISKHLIDKLGLYFVQNTQVLLFGGVCGVGVGAAVTTGIGIGILSVKNVPIWCGDSFVSIKRWMNRMIFQFDSSLLEEEQDKKKNPLGQEDDARNSPSINSSNGVVTLKGCVRESNIILIQGLPYTNHERNQVVPGSPEKQCDCCLNMINSALAKNLITWNNTARLTVHLVEGKCDAKLFRRCLEEYPFSGLLSIYFVLRLEDKNAVVQVEAFAYS